MTHIALEGRVFVLSACQSIQAGAYPDWYREAIGEAPEAFLMRGGSAIIAPDGTVLAGPVFDTETILYAEADLGAITRGHLDMDAVGHYSRPDIFELRVETRRQQPVVFSHPVGVAARDAGRGAGETGPVGLPLGEVM